MQALTKLRSRLTYANAMSTIAVFVALGGGAYAVTVPRNSVGPKQLKKNAVTAAKVKNRSLLASDFKRGQLSLGTAARADDLDPPPAPSGTNVARMTLTTRGAGKVFVIGSLRDPFLTCADTGCSAQWGVYVDDKPVPSTGATLSALPGESDGFSFYTLYGVTAAKVGAGVHVIRIVRTDSGGPSSVGQLGAQLSAIQITG
ncbi:MAG: hypothetical protein ACRDLQ_00850 [Solirubrobacterales bacterium]